MRIWKCPRCESGVRAPDKPRRDDVRGYCLDCSATTGWLVRRICPSHNRRKEQARKRRGFRDRRKEDRVDGVVRDSTDRAYKLEREEEE